MVVTERGQQTWCEIHVATRAAKVKEDATGVWRRVLRRVTDVTNEVRDPSGDRSQGLA